MQDPNEFKEKLQQAINSCSAEGFAGDTPDFIAAELLFDVLAAIGKAAMARDEWFGFKKPAAFEHGPSPIEHGYSQRASLREVESWSEAPPSEPGLYWVLRKGRVVPAELTLWDGRLLVRDEYNRENYAINEVFPGALWGPRIGQPLPPEPTQTECVR